MQKENHHSERWRSTSQHEGLKACIWCPNVLRFFFCNCLDVVADWHDLRLCRILTEEDLARESKKWNMFWKARILRVLHVASRRNRFPESRKQSFVHKANPDSAFRTQSWQHQLPFPCVKISAAAAVAMWRGRFRFRRSSHHWLCW